MAYRLKRKESVVHGLKRVARQQLDRAEREAGDERLDPAAQVHQIRKRIKKLRALLRLVRDKLGKKRYRRDNAHARRLARRLAGSRDAQVMLETATALAGDYPALADAGFERLQAYLLADAGYAYGEADLEDALLQSRQGLAELRERVSSWSLPNTGFDTLEPGFRRAYRRGRKALRRVQKDAGDERLHDWRKRVKDHWYHCRLLEDVWPGLMTCQIRELKVLSELLGDHHDLAVFETTVAQLPVDVMDDRDKRAWNARLGREKDHLLRDALRLGRRVYAEKPKALSGRYASYWKTWQRA